MISLGGFALESAPNAPEATRDTTTRRTWNSEGVDLGEGWKSMIKLLLMDKILHHLGWLKPLNNGIIIILGGAGFCPSTVSPPKKN